MLNFMKTAGTQVCHNLFGYARKWKQATNVAKTVFQVFHSHVKQLGLKVKIDDSVPERVRSFKYLGFTWTDKLSITIFLLPETI